MFTTMLTMALLLIFILQEYLSYKEIGKEKSNYEVIILLLSIALFGVSSEQFVYFNFDTNEENSIMFLVYNSVYCR